MNIFLSVWIVGQLMKLGQLISIFVHILAMFRLLSVKHSKLVLYILRYEWNCLVWLLRLHVESLNRKNHGRRKETFAFILICPKFHWLISKIGSKDEHFAVEDILFFAMKTSGICTRTKWHSRTKHSPIKLCRFRIFVYQCWRTSIIDISYRKIRWYSFISRFGQSKSILLY